MEFGWTITHPGYRNGGLSTQLVGAAMEQLRRRRDIDLGFGFPRSLTMYRLISERVAPPSICTGHDGGLNIANGLREYHLATVTNLASAFIHVIPRSNQIAHSDFVRSTVFCPLALSPAVCDYPPDLVVGPSEGATTVVQHTRVRYRFDQLSPARALQITALDSGADPETVHHDLEAFLARLPTALHVSLYLLVDKEDLLRRLRSVGFEIAAYFPAWHLCRGRRYDCVLLIKRNYTEEPVSHGVADIVGEFRYEFSKFYT
jgi:hypothetical protein